MNEQFTPGTWIIDPSPTLPLAIIANTEDGDGICEIGERTTENLANAHLIAAAPDMYEALKKIIRDANDTLSNLKDPIGRAVAANLRKTAKAALSKANPR